MFGNSVKTYFKIFDPSDEGQHAMTLSVAAKTWLKQVFGDHVLFDESMARHTSFRIGGPADALVKPAAETEISRLINWAQENDTPWTVIGRGTNLLVRDHGIRGVVIAVTKRMSAISREGEIVTAMAGAGLPALCRFATEQGLAGMNFAVGIPGTVGGGIVMNAGTPTGAMGDVVHQISVLRPDGSVSRLNRSALTFRYRQLTWPIDLTEQSEAQPPIICSASFKLRTGATDEIKSEGEKLLRRRHLTQPTDLPSAGCVFKNPQGERSAGELIDKAGLKGVQVGGAKVSNKHANYVVNTGTARAADVLKLMDTIQATVWNRFQVKLEPEVTIVG